VIWLGRVAGGGADTAVFFGGDFLVREVFLSGVAPIVAANFRMQIFAEGLGEAVGEGFGHDRVVIVVLAVEGSGQLIAAEAGRDGEGADVVLPAAVFGGDEVGQRVERVL